MCLLLFNEVSNTYSHRTKQAFPSTFNSLLASSRFVCSMLAIPDWVNQFISGVIRWALLPTTFCITTWILLVAFAYLSPQVFQTISEDSKMPSSATRTHQGMLNRKNCALEGRQWYVCAAVWKQVVWGKAKLQVFLGSSREGCHVSVIFQTSCSNIPCIIEARSASEGPHKNYSHMWHTTYDISIKYPIYVATEQIAR